MARILIMEDEEDFGSLLQDSLSQAGHETTLRKSATEAFAEYKRNAFDLVVADLIVKQDGRPVPDGGLTLISDLKRNMRKIDRSVPVIAISGITQYPGLESALTIAHSIGADASLPKPFAPQELLELIDNLLAQQAN